MSVVSAAVAFAAPWAHLYGNSKALATGVTFAHLSGMLVAGGFALATDRATLRFVRGNRAAEQSHLTSLHAIHRPVILALILTFVSGLLLLGADLETYLPAPVFWVKMGVILVLLGNGAVLQRAETSLRQGTPRPERAWRLLRGTAWLSLGLWFVAVFLGTALVSI